MELKTEVFPAHAGVILEVFKLMYLANRFSRTRGGDPITFKGGKVNSSVFPAHAGVILLEIRARNKLNQFFPHTRG